MVQGTFVLSAHVPKTQKEKERVKTRSTKFRYAVVVLAIAVVFFYQYCFDNPSALQENIQTNYHDAYHEELGGSQFNLLYSVYSFPNVIIPLIGGTLIDRIGARVVFIITCALCVVGQLIFAFGGFSMLFWLMLVGRVVFGAGGEVLQGAQSTIISNWFKPEELSLILGICLAFSKIGSSLNNYVTPIIAEHFKTSDPDSYKDVGMSLFAGFIVMVIGLLCTFVMAYIDKSTEKESDEVYEKEFVSDNRQKRSASKIISVQKVESQPFYSPQRIGKKLPTIKEELLKQDQSEMKMDQSEDNYLESHKAMNKTQKKEEQDGIEEEEKKEGGGGQHVNFKEILKLPASYWLLIVISMFCESLFIPFLDNGNKYYTAVFIGIESPEDAGIYLVVPYVLAAVIVPFLGVWVERVEQRSVLIILTVVSFWLAYVVMMVAETSTSLRSSEVVRWIPVGFLGIGTGMFCAIIVPTLPMIVNAKLLGTAFGLMEMLQNLALGLFPIIIGAIRERVSDHELLGFHQQSLFFFLTGCVTIGLAFVLKAVDKVSGSHIDKKGFRQKFIHDVLEPVTIVEY